MNTSVNNAVTLAPSPQLSKGEEYNFLKLEGTTLLQALSGNIWIDYNEHDPGVTTLEQLCYALTDLSYRAEFSVADLLSNERNQINLRRQGLYIPKRIFPCNPVTENDYRKLIMDRVHEVKNVWISPFIRNKCHPSRNVAGLYHIRLYIPDDIIRRHECPERFIEEIRHQVFAVYNQHRGLCEDIQKISVLCSESLFVEDAAIIVKQDVSAEKALAEALFAIQQQVSPEVLRYSLQQEKNQEKTSGEIFNGPLMHNGFIHNYDLGEQPETVPVRNIAGAISAKESILNVSDISLRAKGKIYQEADTIEVENNAILQLDVHQALRKIRVFRQGIEIQANESLTLKELAQLWHKQRQTFPLDDQYSEIYPDPKGKNRHLENYYSIQDQYPNVYGINQFGLPEESSDLRQAQAKQFKAYLLVFEQVLANFLSQLSHIKDLYCIEKQQWQTYFYQFLDNSVPNIEPLLNTERYYEGLQQIVESPSVNIERRNQFLDLLLALYGEELSADSIWVTSKEHCCHDSRQEQVILAKLAFLHWLVFSTHNRGKGFNYLKFPGRFNLAGMAIKARIQLGMGLPGSGSLRQFLEDSPFKLDQSDASLKPIRKGQTDIENEFSPCSMEQLSEQTVDESSYEQAFSTIQSLHKQYNGLPEELIQSLGDASNYRIGSFGGSEELSIVIRLQVSGEWLLLDGHHTHISANIYIQACLEIIAPIHQHCQQLYIIEHNMLRFGRSRRHHPHGICGEDQMDEFDHCHPPHPCHHDFDYNFTITAVISTFWQNRTSKDYRRFVEEVIRANTPSHIAIRYCYLKPWQNCYFEELYYSWRLALYYQKDKRAIVNTSAQLRDFLVRHQNRR